MSVKYCLPGLPTIAELLVTHPTKQLKQYNTDKTSYPDHPIKAFIGNHLDINIRVIN